MASHAARLVWVRAYIVTAALSFVSFAVAIKLWHANIHVPFAYALYGDTIGPLRTAKDMVESGWVFWNPLLAAPYGQDFGDIPIWNTWHLVVQKLLLLLVLNHVAVAVNLFYLICPILNAVVALFALRRLHVPVLAAVPAAVIYGNLYQLFMRQEAHIFFSAYYLVPLGCLAALLIARGEPMFFTADRRVTVDGWIVIGAALAIGLENPYDAVFSALLVMAAVAIGALQAWSLRPILPAAAYAVFLAAGMWLNQLPSKLWAGGHEPNPAVYQTFSSDAFVYAFMPAQLVLPIPDHRLKPLAYLNAMFHTTIAGWINENSYAALGTAGTIGLLLLFAALAVRPPRVPTDLRNAALLCLAGIGIGTMGGVGGLIGVFVDHDIRAYNRISSFVAFFCIFAFALGLAWLGRVLQADRRRALAMAAVAVIAFLGVMDQSPADPPFPYALSAAQYGADNAWVQTMARAIPANGSIFQLPFVPQTLQPIGKSSWDIQRENSAYMFSSTIHWSYGGIPGRKPARFEEWVSQLPVDQMVAALLMAGFDGIDVYRQPYIDNNDSVEPQLAKLLGPPTFVRPDGSEAFYSLDAVRPRVRGVDPAVGTPADLEAVDARVSLVFGGGFSFPETGKEGTWHWATRHAELYFFNDGPAAQNVAISGTIEALRPGTIITVTSPNGTEEIDLAKNPKFSLQFAAAPGATRIGLTSNGRDVLVSNDTREHLNFRLLNVVFHADGAPALAAHVARDAAALRRQR